LKGNLDHTNNSKDNWAEDIKSYIEQYIGIENPECPEEQDITAAPNVLQLIWPTQNSQRQAGKVFVTDNPIEMRRNQGVKK
jgi:hypothetical protein